MARYGLAMLVCLLMGLAPARALAHDDPVLTVRVLCQGLTDGQIDTAMGEIDDSASVNVDRPLSGRAEIIAWMQQQLSLNLRIEVINIRPTQIGDGYDVSWTTHMFREDWRKAGVPMRQTTEHAIIHNGRITQWTSSLGAAQQPANARQADAAQQALANPASASAANAGERSAADVVSVAGVPLSQVPIGLVLLLMIAAAAAAWLARSALRRPAREPRGDRVVSTIESLAPRAAERKR